MAGRKRSASIAEDAAAGPSKKSSKRTVSKSTFEKWQREYERDHQTLTWLRCDLDRDRRHVVSLFCSVCRKYEVSLQSLKNFSRTWIAGSTNQKVSNVLDHARSDVHKAAMAKMTADTVKASGGSAVLTSAIGRSMCTLDIETRARMKRKFDLCFVMAKESIAFSKYPALLQLEERHGVDMGHAYGTAESAKSFTGFIAKSQRQGFLTSLSTSTRFFSVLMDGTTDVGNVEEELIAIVYRALDDTSRQVATSSRFLSLHSPKRADAGGLLECLGEALKLVGIESVLDKDSVLSVSGKPVLIGVGTDGASVNVGEQTGLKGQMQSALPWLFWSWCYAHRIELACKDAFSSSLFSSIQEMLLRLYYIYEKSAKKSRELENIVTDLGEAFDLVKGGNRPIRSCGTRWITHKRRALQRVVDRYGAYIAHLSTLVEDSSLKAVDRARLKGYLVKWKQPKLLVGCAMYIDALKPVSLLSLSLQGNDTADIVISIESTLKSAKTLQSLTQKDPSQWPKLKLLRQSTKEVDGEQQYQGVPLDNLDAAVDQCKTHVVADVERLREKMKERLGWTDTELLRALLVLVETQSWQQKDPDAEDDENMTELQAAVQYITSAFHAPLESKEVCVSAIQDELEQAVEYARAYLPIATESYRKVWYTLHTCPDARKWPNLLSLCELAFSLPFTTSRVEQMFSMLNTIKTKRRTSLHTSTLCDLLEVTVEGPAPSDFDANAAVDQWWKECCTTRRVNQNPRKEYRPRTTTSDTAAEEDKEVECSIALEDWDDWMVDKEGV